MSEALRELLALAEVKVVGGEAIASTMKKVDALKASLAKPLQASGERLGDDAFAAAGRRALIGLQQYRNEAQQTAPTQTLLNASLVNFAAGMNVAGQALGIAKRIAEGTVGPLVDMTREVIGLGDALDATSKRTGLSASELQRWQFIAERGNVDADALTSSIGRLQRAAVEHGAAFHRLGVNVRDANGQIKPSGDLFREVGLALARIPNAAERAARAQQVFGRSGAALLPVFADGAEGLDALSRRFDELGGGLSQDAVDGANKADDALNDFNLSLRSLKATLVVGVLPALGSFVSGAATALGTLVETVRTSSIAQTAIIGLGAAFAGLAVVSWPLWAPIVAIGAGLGALFFVAEDVVTAFRGGESVFGKWEEKLAKSLGVTLTFKGQLQAMGLAWLDLKSRILDAAAGIVDAVARVRTSLGLPTDPRLKALSADAHAAADAAARDERKGHARLVNDERQRGADRAVFAAQDAIAATQPGAATLGKFGAAAEPAVVGRGRGRSTHTTHVRAPVTIHISGAQDPQALAQAIDARLGEHFWDASETLPNGPDADEEDGGG